MQNREDGKPAVEPAGRITFLVHKGKEYTVEKYLRSWGRNLAVPVRVRNYPGIRSTARKPWKRLEQALRGWKVGALAGPPGPPGTPQIYVLTDIDRLDRRETETARALRRRLAADPDTADVLNHPRRSMRRFELLDTLNRRGINRFAVYRADEDPRPRSWPVFVRGEGEHGGQSPLLGSPAELERHLAALASRRGGLAGKVVIEFFDAAGEDGVIRKYGAFRVGGRILARQIHFSRRWVVRFPDIREPATAAEELAYVESNPHRRELAEIFSLARIDYGRCDYSVVGGRIQVWEINTNPMILIPKDREDPLRAAAHDAFGRAFNAALEELAASRRPTSGHRPTAGSPPRR
jgi:hypothetical protein